MKINKIDIRNILGITHLEIAPGQVTVISGENGTGKTSVLEALKSVFLGGSDATLLRTGAESGEVVLLFDDGVKVKKTVGATKSSVTVEHPTMGAMKKAQTYLSGLIDPLGLNPIEFLLAPAKTRTQMLLESMPIDLDSDEIKPIIGRDATARETDDPLSFIASERQRFYDERTGVNRTAKDKRATIEQMKATLPADDTIDWARMVKTLEGELASVLNSWNEEAQRVKDGAVESEEKVRSSSQKTIDASSKEIDGGIAELRAKIAELQNQINSLESAKGKAVAQFRQEESENLLRVKENQSLALSELSEHWTPRKEEINEKIAVARENLSNQSKINQTKEYIDLLSKEATVNEMKSDNCTAAIDALDKLKIKLVSKLPIKGVEIRDGQIYVNDIVFDRLNESQKVRLAIDIAKLRAGALDLIIVDGLERLDEKTFAQFKKQIAKESAQFIVTRVSDAAFSVEAQ